MKYYVFEQVEDDWIQFTGELADQAVAEVLMEDLSRSYTGSKFAVFGKVE